MKFAPPSARPAIGRACLHQQLRSSSCEACRSACPFDAIAPEKGRMVIDADKCSACGNCLFVCPTSALENLPAAKRRFHLDTLVAPLSALPPTVQELLAWHSERGIRRVEIDPDAAPGWLLAVATLNLRLKQLGEPGWSIALPQETPVNAGRRRWLQVNQNGSDTARVSPVPYRKLNGYAVALDQSRCYLCGACARICPTGAIDINDEAMTLQHERCVGCRACTDLCLPQALRLQQAPTQSATLYPLEARRCATCRQPFLTWPEGKDQCPLCQRHAYGMRET
jgi:NAD-dependent dihydropyrimidine dehydrogenase PreA subunit